MSILMPSVDVIMNMLTLAVYFLWWVIISQAALDSRLGLFSDMMVFSSYASQLIMSFVMLVFVLVLIPWAAVSAKRIAEVLNTDSLIKDWDYDKDTKIKWKVEFKNVCFRYPDAEEEVVSDISFTAEQWETVALIWSTGCWKSSIINLIPRFYDVTSWEILIDWINVKDYNQKALRDKIWYISQKAFIFRWDIKDNIFLWLREKDKTQKNLETASKISESEEFIKELEDWFEEYVALWGNNYSWGQKQRISIARAIARKPEILIFDDSFSALDYKTDLKLRSNLKTYLKWCTIFIVAQRIWTIKHADKILVIDEGKCVWIWKHEELLKTCKVYKEIALSQLSEEELKKK
jgi:ATP-binding cassette subfamily B protein